MADNTLWLTVILLLEILPHLKVQPLPLHNRRFMPRLFRSHRHGMNFNYGPFLRDGGEQGQKRTKYPRTPRGGGVTRRTRPPNWKGSSSEEGMPRNETYDPTLGYEPYWAGGDWVLDKDWGPGRGWWEKKYIHMENTTELPVYTTEGQKCPMEDCPLAAIPFGSICARNKDDKLRTFGNYCEFLHIDCKDLDDWIMVYRGECIGVLKPYDPRHAARPDNAFKFMVDWLTSSPSTLAETSPLFIKSSRMKRQRKKITG